MYKHPPTKFNTPNKPTAMSGSAEQPGSAPEQTSMEPAAPQHVKHLLVQDNPIGRRILATTLMKLGIPTHAAGNGKQGVEVYKADPEKCRFIIMDLHMPIMDGVTAAREIRNYEEENGLQPAFIVATFSSSMETEDRVGERAKVDGGMNTTLTRPIRLEPLKALLESYPV